MGLLSPSGKAKSSRKRDRRTRRSTGFCVEGETSHGLTLNIGPRICKKVAEGGFFYCFIRPFTRSQRGPSVDSDKPEIVAVRTVRLGQHRQQTGGPIGGLGAIKSREYLSRAKAGNITRVAQLCRQCRKARRQGNNSVGLFRNSREKSSKTVLN